MNVIQCLKNLEIKNFLLILYDKFMEEDVLSSAAQVAFYFSFSIFPLLLFLISLIGMVLDSADDLRNELFYYLSQVMPISAYKLLKDTIQEITQNSTGGKLTIGLLIALWSASAGVDSLRVALNSVFTLKEKRAWWKTKLLSLIVILGLTVMISFSLGIAIYGWKFLSFLISMAHLPTPSDYILMILQWIVVLALLLSVFALIYNYLPSYPEPKWVWITPGAVTAIILWILLSFILKTYLQYYNTYDRMYGSLGAVIILMLWLYLTALVALLGGIVNACIVKATGDEPLLAISEAIAEEEQLTEEERAE
ncbi:MAG: YihY/virulence factor BrkB family protein [Aridibacter sp.]